MSSQKQNQKTGKIYLPKRKVDTNFETHFVNMSIKIHQKSKYLVGKVNALCSVQKKTGE